LCSYQAILGIWEIRIPPLLPHSTAQGDTITVTRKIDANWYEGYLGDQKGIFPVTYVQLLEEGKR